MVMGVLLFPSPTPTDKTSNRSSSRLVTPLKWPVMRGLRPPLRSGIVACALRLGDLAHDHPHAARGVLRAINALLKLHGY